MSARILPEHGIECDVTLPVRLSGYELSIRPRVNLQRKLHSFVYGRLAEITHTDIESLYGGLKHTFGITYQPFPVLAELADGTFRPALCYLSFDIKDAPADPIYVHALAECATELHAPEPYVQHIRSFVHPMPEARRVHRAVRSHCLLDYETDIAPASPFIVGRA
jgi:hypothetical protein